MSATEVAQVVVLDDTTGHASVVVYGFTTLADAEVPNLAAALCRVLTVDARRALTRDLAAQDGDAVVRTEDAADGAALADAITGGKGLRLLRDRLRAAVEAARPVHTEEAGQ